MEKRFSLGQHGRQLWTRERAREIRQEIEALLRKLAPGDILVVDTKGVEVFDFSFANELFGKLLLAAPQDHSGRFIIVENLTTYTRENLTNALETMSLAVIERKGSKLDILGKIHPVDKETFKAVAQAKEPITASALKDKLAININAMNERLSKLVGLGIVRRERGVSSAGREHYEYSTVT